ncbi:hypothetical protein JNW90_23620 [Micromonospora sp. STR1s_5]|nr:hypothetical protein [Micromonospora sp. STR1s_5]
MEQIQAYRFADERSGIWITRLMSPGEYVDTVALPTLKEAMQARGDRRLVYLACIVIYHIADYLAVGRGVSAGTIRDAIKPICGRALKAVQHVTNGAKHAGGDQAQWSQPGLERDLRAFGFGPGFAGFDDGRWDHPGLSIQIEGTEVMLDTCAQVVLLALCSEYPIELGAADLSFLDRGVLQGSG